MMTTNNRTEKRAQERALIRKAKRQRNFQRADDAKTLLVTLEYVEDERNDDGELVEVVKTRDIFVPNLKTITKQEMTRIVRAARTQGDDAATDLLLETLLGIEDYEFLLYEIDADTFEFVGEKAVTYVFGAPEKPADAKDDEEEGK